MRRRPNGFSLMEIVLALGIGSVIILFSGDLIIQSQVQSQRSSTVTDADQIHLINVQRSRNPRFIRDFVYQGADTPGSAENKALMACFSGKTPRTGCARFNQTTPATFSDPDLPTTQFLSTIEIRRQCNGNDCGKIQVEVRTRDNNLSDKVDIFDRHSVSYLPGYAFVDDGAMDMTCAPSIMTGLNAYRMLPECGAPEGNFQCPGGDRIINIGIGAAVNDPSLCLPMARQTCNSATQFGTNDLGILTLQPTCQGYAVVTGASCVPTWAPRLEDVCAPIDFTQADGCGYTRTVRGTKECTTIMPSTTISNWTPPPPPTAPPTTSSTTTTTPPPTTTVPPTSRPECGNSLYTTSYVSGQASSGIWAWEPGGTVCLLDGYYWYASSLANCYSFNNPAGAWTSGTGYLCQISVTADPGYTCSGARAIQCDPPTATTTPPPTTAPPPPVLPIDGQNYRNVIQAGGPNARSDVTIRVHSDGSWSILFGGNNTGGTWTRTGAPLSGTWATSPVGAGWEVRFIYGGFTGGYTYNSGRMSGHDPIGNYASTNWTPISGTQSFELIAQADSAPSSAAQATYMITVEIRNTINGSQMSGTANITVGAYR